MGDKNVTFNKCISEKERYAECFNLAVGKNVISAKGLHDIDTVLSERHLNGQGTYEKRRDCIKAYGTQAVCAILGIENQTDIHSAMVVRSLIYDAYSYDKQLRFIRKQHREQKDLTGAEYVAGFSETDHIIPVITVCVYYGEEPWKSPVRLHDLIDFEQFPEEIREFMKQLVNDYNLIVLDVPHMNQDVIDSMKTDLRYLFGILKNSNDKDAMKEYISCNQNELANVDEDIYNAIAAITNTEALDNVIQRARKMEGGMDMCKAFEEMIAEGKAEERKFSIQNLVLTLREIGVDETVIIEKVMLRYQLSQEEAKKELA